MKTMKVLIPAGDLPDGTVVTKKNGTNKFVIGREIKVYGVNAGDVTSVYAKEGVVFLIPRNGSKSIDSIQASKEVEWKATIDELTDFWGVDDE